jgi:hypothetical protein
MGIKKNIEYIDKRCVKRMAVETRPQHQALYLMARKILALTLNSLRGYPSTYQSPFQVSYSFHCVDKSNIMLCITNTNTLKRLYFRLKASGLRVSEILGNGEVRGMCMYGSRGKALTNFLLEEHLGWLKWG